MGATKLRKELSDVIQEKLSVLHQVWSEMCLSKEEVSDVEPYAIPLRPYDWLANVGHGHELHENS